VKGRKQEVYDNRRLYTTGEATVLKMADLPAGGAGYQNDVLQMLWRVPGVQVSGSGANASVRIRGDAALLLLDGTPVTTGVLATLMPNELETIEVLKGASAAVYGSRAAGGVVAFFTKRGSANGDLSSRSAPGSLAVTLPGFYQARAFYVPNHGSANATPARPDHRPTLYWNPSVTTDSTGKATLSFYTSDDIATFAVRAEGLSREGVPAMGTAAFRVKSR